MGEYLNIIMIVGIIIIISGIIYGIITSYKLSKKNDKKLIERVKWRVIMLIIVFIGIGIVQYGDDVRKITLNKQEMEFIKENKKFSSFTEEEFEMYHKTRFTYEKSKPETYEKYYTQFVEWGIDNYLEENKHRAITREEAKIFVEKNMNTSRSFYLEEYCKILCKLAMYK